MVSLITLVTLKSGRVTVLKCRQKEDSEGLYIESSEMDFLSFFDSNRVAIVKKPYHLVFCIFNFIIPGLGTMLSAFPRFNEHDKSGVNWAIIIDGIMQQLLSLIVFGYVWSCWAGVTMYRKRMQCDLK